MWATPRQSSLQPPDDVDGDDNDDDDDDDDDDDFGVDVGDDAGVGDGGYLERNHHVVLQGLRDGVVPAR